MTSLFELVGPDREGSVKEAFAPLAGKALMGIGSLMGRAGKAVVKNPLKSLGTAFTGADMISKGNMISSASSAAGDAGRATQRITM
jgi:hypothetical protein